MSPEIPATHTPVFAALALIASLAPLASAQLIADGSFEVAACPSGWFAYNPTGTPWTYLNHAGVTAPPSPFGAPTPPSGWQVAFLQADTQTPLAHGEISQVISLPATGSYTLSYLHAGRNYSGYAGNVTYDVWLDSTIIATLSTFTGQPFTPVSVPFTASGGGHTLAFRFSPGQPLRDNTAFFDSMELVPSPGAVGLFGLAGLALRRRRR